MSRHPHALAVLARLDGFVLDTARSRFADERDLPALLRSLVEGAIDVVPGARAAGVLELSPRGVLSRHATGAWSRSSTGSLVTTGRAPSWGPRGTRPHRPLRRLLPLAALHVAGPRASRQP